MSPQVEALKARAETLYRQTERWHAPTAFVAGFLWDSLTLKRIDKLTDNALLGLYLVALGALLVLHPRAQREPERWPRLAPHVERLEWLVQFLFGGLYSAYVVFYFKSAYIGRSLIFLGLLVALMFANEWLSPAKLKAQLRVGQYGFVAFSFLLFCIPVLSGYLGWGVFAVAALGAVGACLLVTWGTHRGSGAPLKPLLLRHGGTTAGLVLGLLLLDVLGLIPPVPLALMESGVYHQVRPSAQGYVLSYEPTAWKPWRYDDREFHYREGDRVWCFTAVFAPRNTALDVVHVWQWWDPERGWQTSDRIPFDVTGGREGGYRAYTAKRHVKEGAWRVVVEDELGRTLGYVPFTVEAAEGEAQLREWRYK
ncbi:MAG: DUF2914 domain-containing protein [Alphaproteobacteria bacterium]|nr:DUF2914 domain-containing protein [Alphaproteobacteria bacterium]